MSQTSLTDTRNRSKGDLVSIKCKTKAQDFLSQTDQFGE